MHKTLLSLMLCLGVSTMITAQLELVKDLRTGAAGALPTGLEGSTDVLDDVLYFPAVSENTFRELIRSDGTADGTYPVLNGNSAVNTPNKLAAAESYFVFRAVSGGTNTIWASDGTNGNTKPILSTALGEFDCMTAIGDKVYFSIPGDATSALWVTDGTQEGTKALKDVAGDKIDKACGFVLNEEQDLVYFIGEKNGLGEELWVTDGTQEGTRMVEEIMPGSGSGVSGELLVFDGLVFFSGNPGSTGAELWISDGTGPGTDLFLEIRSGGIGSSPAFHYADDDAFYFDADNGTNGRELWRSDGSVNGTKLWAEVLEGSNSTSVIGFSPFKDGFIAQLFTLDYGFELHTISKDGEIELVADIVEGTNGIFVTEFVVLDDKYFFTTSTPATGTEVWQTDGTESGTFPLEIVTGGGGSDPDIFGVNENGFFVGARRGDVGRELFYYDKTTSSIDRISNVSSIGIYPNPTSGRINFKMENDARPNQINMYSASGRLVMSMDGNRVDGGVDVSALTPGLYIINMILDDGSLSTGKVMVNH